MVTSKKEKDSIYNFIRPADDNLIGLNRMIIEMKKNESGFTYQDDKLWKGVK